MRHECKITVLETKVFPELQEKYLADPKSGACPCIRYVCFFETRFSVEINRRMEILSCRRAI